MAGNHQRAGPLVDQSSSGSKDDHAIHDIRGAQGLKYQAGKYGLAGTRGCRNGRGALCPTPGDDWIKRLELPLSRRLARVRRVRAALFVVAACAPGSKV